jgi:hypothetical protein
MICSCGGSIVVRVTARDGETAGCERCQRCVTVTGLLAEVDRLRAREAELEKLHTEPKCLGCGRTLDTRCPSCDG